MRDRPLQPGEAPDEKGRLHETGEGWTRPRRVVRSGSRDVPSRLAPAAKDPARTRHGAAIVGIDDAEAPEEDERVHRGRGGRERGA